MHSSKKIVLDFDGTIFRVFTNYNLDNLVKKIYTLVKDYQISFDDNSDAFDVFGSIEESNLSDETKHMLLKTVDKWLIEAEKEALNTGVLVKGFFEFVEISRKRNVDIAIVSNNSAECIEKFLSNSPIDFSIPVLGRIGTKPQNMKPNIYMLKEMSKILNCSNEDIIFIGDNYRDYECATSFGCQFIGMTPTLSKKDKLCSKVKNIEIVNDFCELSSLLWNDN